MDLTTHIGALELRTPLIMASGTYGYGEEYQDLVDFSSIGAISVKGLTLKERSGNPPPRVVETPYGMLNAVGLQNEGVDKFIKEKVPLFKNIDPLIIANISASSLGEFIELVKKLNGIKEISALEVNVSCPNLDRGGMSFGKDPKAVFQLIKEIKKETDFHLMTKLTPNITDITEVALAAEAAGSDSLSLINTLLGMAIDVQTRKPKLANITGGLSGPAIKPVALRMVWEVCQKVKIPVIGMGGISNFSDALEFIIAGATAISIGTINFINPKAPEEIMAGIRQYMKERNISSLKELRGTLKLPEKKNSGCH
ncbi:dihydroorotate dehydrogenase [Candidatus Auribacterota bacterium]